MSLGWREQHTQPAPAAPAEAKPPDGKNSYRIWRQGDPDTDGHKQGSSALHKTLNLGGGALAPKMEEIGHS